MVDYDTHLGTYTTYKEMYNLFIALSLDEELPAWIDSAGDFFTLWPDNDVKELVLEKVGDLYQITFRFEHHDVSFKSR